MSNYCSELMSNKELQLTTRLSGAASKTSINIYEDCMSRLYLEIMHDGSFKGLVFFFFEVQWRFLMNKLCEVVIIFSSVGSVLKVVFFLFCLNQYPPLYTLEETQFKLAYLPLQSFVSLAKSQTEENNLVAFQVLQHHGHLISHLLWH